MLEAHSTHELHREVNATFVVQAQLVDRQHTWMVQPSEHARLANEAPQCACARTLVHFHGQLALQFEITREIDAAHATASNFLCTHIA